MNVVRQQVPRNTQKKTKSPLPLRGRSATNGINTIRYCGENIFAKVKTISRQSSVPSMTSRGLSNATRDSAVADFLRHLTAKRIVSANMAMDNVVEDNIDKRPAAGVYTLYA